MTDALLARVETALNDVIRLHAPERFNSVRLIETQERLFRNGGTWSYIATLLHDVREARKEITKHGGSGDA